MDILKALLLGIIEGITEFLPVSSTAHLLVSEKVLGYKDAAEVFTVVIQLGAIVAAAWYFRKDLLYIIRCLIARDKAMTTFAGGVIIGVLPTALVGLIVEKTIGLPDSLWLISAMLIVGGIVFILVENMSHKTPSKTGDVRYEDITTKKSLLIGLTQCLSIIPGVSRSGATIMGGLLVGLDRKTATVFSFYLSIPIMVAASALKLASDRSAISSISGGSSALIVGVVSAFITACITITWLLKYVTKKDFKPFAYYRIGLGILIIIVLTVQN